MTKVSGSCLCGNVGYSGETEVKMVINCHCTDCQKATGSVHGTLVFVGEDGMTFTGDPGEFEHPADSGNVLTKVFCKDCGSQVAGRNTARVGVIGLRAGTLDQKDLIEPGFNVFCDSAVPTTPMSDGTKKFPRMPG
ncbi:MAG: GFA family protein [Pseudomonadota bacterium]